MPAGFVDSAARDPRNYTLAEYQQAKRMGTTGRDLKTLMIECWAASDSGAAFKQALSERGIILAKGDRRGHVAVTPEGEVLAVARYTGRKTKEVRATLGEPENLPSVEEAKKSTATSMSAAMTKHLAEAKLQHAKALAPLNARRQHMTELHRTERAKLDAGQKKRWDEETHLRANRLNKGLRGLWDRFTGHREKIERQNIAEAKAALDRDRKQRQELINAQLTERRALQSEIKAIRGKQADLLRDLRTERQTYRTNLQEKESRRSPAPASTPDKHSPLKDSFKGVSVPRKEGARVHNRVHRLRANKESKTHNPGRDHEPER